MKASTKEFLVEAFCRQQLPMKFIPLSLAIALILWPVASAMACVVTHGEYLRHFPDKKQPVKLAIEAALVTFIFLVLSFVTGFLPANIVGSRSL